MFTEERKQRGIDNHVDLASDHPTFAVRRGEPWPTTTTMHSFFFDFHPRHCAKTPIYIIYFLCRYKTLPNATTSSAETPTSKQNPLPSQGILTLIIWQWNSECKPALKPIPKQECTVESAQIISPADLVVVRSLGTSAVPHLLALAHPHIR